MKALALALALAIVSAGAHAASDAEEFERAGLFGEWAEDCSQPPSLDNPHYLMQGATDGSVVDSGWFNDKEPSVITIRHFIRRLPENRIEYRTEYSLPKTSTGVRAIVAIEGDRQRVVESIDLKGKVLIKQGKLEDGRATPWYHRCVPGHL